MEQNTQANRTTEILEGQLRECYGRIVYSHKTHLKCADILNVNLKTIKISQIVLSAITTGSFLTTIIANSLCSSIVGIILSTILFGLNMYNKNFDLGEASQKHRHAAEDLWLIREKFLSLITDLLIGGKEICDIQIARDELIVTLNTIYKSAPTTFPKAYKKAQKALKELEDMTFSDEEIDKFLPRQLRKSLNSYEITN